MGTQGDRHTWYRATSWNPEIAEAFEARLARSRTSFHRAQYIRVQASILCGQEDEATRELGRKLLRRVIDEYGDSEEFEAFNAREQLGISLAKDGQDAEAERMLRAVISDVAKRPLGRSGTTHVTELYLAELLTQRGTHEGMTEAWTLLDVAQGHVPSFMRDQVLRVLVCRARLASALGRGDVSSHAVAALEVADESQPSLPRHPEVGRPRVSEPLRRELERLAGVAARPV